MSTMKRDEARYRAIVGPLNVLGEAARWQLAQAQMICYALAAHALLIATRIAAVASLQILFFFAFHDGFNPILA